MGQIFNRISRIARSYLNDDGSKLNLNFESEDDELKRLIDEISKEAKKEKQEKSNFTPPDEKVDLSNAYTILEVNSNSSLEQITASYKKKLKEYHPDRVSNLGKDIQELAHMKTVQINQAYKLIKENRR